MAERRAQTCELLLACYIPPWHFLAGVASTRRCTRAASRCIASHHNVQQVGAKFRQKLPSGQYEFIRAYAGECGDFATCSVFSPMFEFSSQSIAMETAQEVLAALFDAENVAPSERHQSYTVHSEMRQAAELDAQDCDAGSAQQVADDETPQVSRRAFLTGNFARREDSRP